MSEELSPFEKYLTEEYSHIAEAHLKTIETISTFFKNYIAIMTIPVVVAAYLISKGQSYQDLYLHTNFNPILLGGCFLFVTSLTGFAVLLYTINLRLDVILYARTVNGIRKYFYDRSGLDLNEKLRMRRLPQSSLIPAYFEKSYFLPVISAFATLNGFYYFTAFNITIDHTAPYRYISSLSFVMLHFLSYYAYAYLREYSYLKSNIIGIDIDGVLNNHRTQFCSFIKRKFGKSIDPDHLNHIPVHESGLTTWEEDNAVFNDPEYWTSMPIQDDAPNSLLKLKNMFRFKILIFTHRPWPNTSVASLTKDEMSQIWEQALSKYIDKYNGERSKLRKREQPLRRLQRGLLRMIRKNAINLITRLWLDMNNFDYDQIIIEKGNESITDPRSDFRNRFQFARKKNIRFFVEDDLEKAIKLCFICDAVFLLDHPYNRVAENSYIPTNLLRVTSWNEIYRKIRALS